MNVSCGLVVRRFSTVGLFVGLICLVGGNVVAQDRPLSKKQQRAQAKAALEARQAREYGFISELTEKIAACDIIGDRAERERLIAEASETLGAEASIIRELRGQVEINGQWFTPNEIAEKTSADQNQLQYVSLRDKASDDQESHLNLARWAQRRGLQEQSRAHLLRVLDFDPENTQVRRQLGHVNVAGRWLTQEQAEELVAENNRRSELARRWAEPVSIIATRLASPRNTDREQGQELLNNIADPEATYAIEDVLTSQTMPVAGLAIDKIASFEGQAPTGSLLRTAVYHDDDRARQVALRSLKGRETAEFLPELIGMIESPIKSQFVLTEVGFGQLFHRHVFTQQRIDQDVVRQYDQYYVADMNQAAGTNFSAPAVWATMRNNLAEGMTGTMRMENAVRIHNLTLEQRNLRLMNVLQVITDENPGKSPEDWWQWWYDRNDTKIYQRPVSYRSESLGTVMTRGATGISHECFVAGTLVWTEAGLAPIETLKTGDRVLAKDLKSERLVYRNVVNTTTREPTPTIKIQLPNETLQVSGGHAFRVAGKGWMRARDLKPGMPLTSRAGSVLVEAVSQSTVEPLFNLVVERDANYFVGTEGVLSHDHTIPKVVVKPTAASR